MVVPDFELICEIMLVAEGFLEARALARKFITLYQLCKELLSKQVSPLLCSGSPKIRDVTFCSRSPQNQGCDTLPCTSRAGPSELLVPDCLCGSCWEKVGFVITRAMTFSNCSPGGSAGTEALDQLHL